jgi:hypothetical protein
LYLLSGTFVEQPLSTGCPLAGASSATGQGHDRGKRQRRVPAEPPMLAILPARLTNCQGGSASIGREAPAADEGQQVGARLGDFSANICIPLTCLRSKWREQ